MLTNYFDFKGFYEGNLSLRKSFWLYFVLLYLFIFRIGLGFIYLYFTKSLGVQFFENFNVLSIINLIAFYFVLVGTWRSASKLASQRYQDKIIYANVAWSWLVKFFLLCTLVHFFYIFFYNYLIG